MGRLVILIKRVLVVLVCLAAVLAGALFAFENPQKIAPIFWGLPFPSLSVGYYLIFLFVFGILAGATLAYLSGSALQRKHQRQIHSLTKQLQKSRSEMSALNAQTAKANSSS